MNQVKYQYSSEHLFNDFIDAIHDRSRISGLTHSFYRYPACFSPNFARTAIKAFSNPGDIVFDPFMGGGTTLVEARALGRRAMGTDINSLAAFISNVKTTPLSKKDIDVISSWAETIKGNLCLRRKADRAHEWIQNGYQRNLDGKNTWPIRKTIELILNQLTSLPVQRQRNLVRCVILKTGKWALDCKSKMPKAKEFRERFFYNLEELIKGAREFSLTCQKADSKISTKGSFRKLCLNCSVIGIEGHPKVSTALHPKLILTSPPYPGVHVIYHRWQIKGRKETPAPYWIANCEDSYGESFYTFGNRQQPLQKKYFEELNAAFSSISKLADNNTLVIQMVSFSEPAWQLPKYLEIMSHNGFKEIIAQNYSDSHDSRLWRNVPNRKWYTQNKPSVATKHEVVLFHKLSS